MKKEKLVELDEGRVRPGPGALLGEDPRAWGSEATERTAWDWVCPQVRPPAPAPTIQLWGHSRT